VALVEVGDCIFDAKQLALSHGYEGLDPVAREAFVNHRHFGIAEIQAVDDIVTSWVAEMRGRWPGRKFRIYRQAETDEITLRYHMVRAGSPNWCEEGIEVMVIGGRDS
jgi:hypothetical protein